MFAITAAAACGTAFVDPHPPVLVGGVRVLESGSVPGPVVYGLVLDLDVADPALCASIAARALGILRSAAAATGAAARELPLVDLAPGCHQAAYRWFDAGAYDLSLRQAEAAFPGQDVRAVVLYLDDVALPAPWGVASGFQALQSTVASRGGLPPRLYGLTRAAGTGVMPFDVSLTWTFGEDDAMWSSLATRLAAELPFASRAPTELLAPLLDASVASRAVGVKLCGIEGNARVSGCGAVGSACSGSPEGALVDATFPPARAIPRDRVPPVHASVRYEACVDRCDRFVNLDDGLARWTQLDGCVTEAP